MDEYFTVTGGQCVYNYDNVDVLVGPKNITFVTKNSRFTYPFISSKKNRFYSTSGKIFYKNGDRVNCFDTTLKKNTDVCKWHSKILDDYSCGGYIILQFSKCLVRVRDGASIPIRSKTDYIIKGDNKYIVVANVRFRDSHGKWSHFKQDNYIRSGVKGGEVYELYYRVLTAPDFTIIGKSSVGIDGPKTSELANGTLHAYLEYIKNNVRVNKSYIKIFNTYLEYNYPGVPPNVINAKKPKQKILKEECCICFENRKSVVFGVCKHRTCYKCVTQITECPLCRAEITTYANATVC